MKTNYLLYIKESRNTTANRHFELADLVELPLHQVSLSRKRKWLQPAPSHGITLCASWLKNR
jgi:hypothetical protein